MLYRSIIVAASALASFAAAQNETTPIPCCTLPANQIDDADREAMCNANQNTCVELCGGVGDIASNGNTCDIQTLENSCTCSNGTDITSELEKYQQSVSGLMCLNNWFDACITAAGNSAAARRACTAAQQTCGNLTVGADAGDNSSPSSSPSGSQTSPTSAGSSPTGSSAPASSSPAAGAAGNVAAYSAPILAGGLLALFGLAL